MKSTILLIFTIAATVSIVACNKDKKNDADLSVRSGTATVEQNTTENFGTIQNENSDYLPSDHSYENNRETVSSTGSSNYDKMLDDYEEYVTQYIQFYKKAKNRDHSALAEYPSIMQKAVDLQESMEKAQNDNELSSAQVARMMKIQAKMMEGMY